jgi:succinate dehydrogenase / fumarate reductase cytochrome b subunit
MGFVLDFKNRAARPIKYIRIMEQQSSPWASRNMISGSVVLAFWHCIFYDFGFQKWCISMNASPLNETRYFHEIS